MNNAIKTLFFVLFPFLLLSQEDEKRFGIGLIAGFTASQVDGDDLQGYDKLGLLGGIRSIAYISSTINFSTELLYSERGSKTKGFNTPANSKRIDLAYAEVAFMVNIKGWYNPFARRHRAEFSGGVSYARLIKHHTVDNNPNSDYILPDLESFFNTTDIAIKAGVSYFILENFGASLRASRSVTKIFDSDKSGFANTGVKDLSSYYLSFHLFYIL